MSFESNKINRREFIKFGVLSVVPMASMLYGIDQFFSKKKEGDIDYVTDEALADNKRYPPMNWGDGVIKWKDVQNSNVEELVQQIKTPSEAASLFSVVSFYNEKAQKIAGEYALRNERKGFERILIPRLNTMKFSEWLPFIKKIAQNAELIEQYWDTLDIDQIEQLFRKHRPEENSYDEGHSSISSALYRVYAHVVLGSEMSDEEKANLLSAPLEEREFVPYELKLPDSYTTFDRSAIIATKKNYKLDEMEEIYNACNSVTQYELPVCRDATKALMLLLHDNGYPALELQMKYRGEFEKAGHVVYLVKGIMDDGNIGYGYIGFNGFEEVRPKYKNVKELFEEKFAKEFDVNYRIIDYTRFIDKSS